MHTFILFLRLGSQASRRMHCADSEQTTRMGRLSWVFVERACTHVRNAVPGSFIVYDIDILTKDMRRWYKCDWNWVSNTKTYLYSSDLIKPLFYIVKLGFTGETLFFVFLLKNIDCGHSLEPPRRGGSNKFPQSMFRAVIWKISEFLSENFQFLEVRFSIYLNRHVFVTKSLNASKYENVI